MIDISQAQHSKFFSTLKRFKSFLIVGDKVLLRKMADPPWVFSCSRQKLDANWNPSSWYFSSWNEVFQCSETHNALQALWSWRICSNFSMALPIDLTFWCITLMVDLLFSISTDAILSCFFCVDAYTSMQNHYILHCFYMAVVCACKFRNCFGPLRNDFYWLSSF